MTKAFVDQLIHNMKQAGMITKASAWMVEGFGEKAMNVRYVGIECKDGFEEIFPPQNNLLLKFITARNEAFIEFYLANTPPFIKIISQRFSETDKWETLLGEIKRRLKKDKYEYINHIASIDNIYARIHSHIRN